MSSTDPLHSLLRVVGVVLLLGLLASSLRAGPETHRSASGATGAASNRAFGFAEGFGDVANATRILDETKAFGASWVRVDLDWWHVESSPGAVLRWDHLDPYVDGAVARGMHVLVTLDFAPPWANGGHANDKWFPTHDADWASIIDRTIAHLGSKVQAYEVWNEPNSATFGKYASDKKVRYWQLVRIAHQHMCSGCTLLAGASSTAPSPDRPDQWLDWAYANGYGNDFDAVAHHPYPSFNSGLGPEHPECGHPEWNMFGPAGEDPPCGELAYLHKIMTAHGDTAKKVWGTEWGYAMSGTPTPRDVRAVSNYDVDGLHMWRGLSYTGPLFMYRYRDTCSNPSNSECNFGIVRKDFSRKEPRYSNLSAALNPVGTPNSANSFNVVERSRR